MNPRKTPFSPSILLTNDDGIFARGLEILAREIAKKYPVQVVAPESEQSAVGHALTLTQPLRVRKVFKNGKVFGFGVNGTPADCVKIALHELITPTPRLLISGINTGPNVGLNVIYSGTVSAATEGAMMGLTALAVSINSYRTEKFETAARIAAELVDRLSQNPLPPGVSLNINVPDLPRSKIKGIRLVRQGTFRYQERFERRTDPRDNIYYWQAGILPPPEEAPDTDHALLAAGYVTLTPISFDLTHYPSLNKLNFLEKTISPKK
ncbi:MAG: 5'/3'-nucleotidase SurE [Thermodesulfobacteriota bacterium]